ncbi:MAG: hypothetical protein ACOYNY_08145 [Caldilineaceae bacterium]
MSTINTNAITERTLSVTVWAGLANRLRVLLSGMVVAAASNRRFTMLWPRTRDCAASFDELFANDWPVQDVPLIETIALPAYTGYYCRPLPDVLRSTVQHLALRTPHWLIAPTCLPHHAPLAPRCEALMNELQPLPALSAAVAAFRAAHFRPQMIGVHLRRGDYLFYYRRVTNNLESSFRAVDRLLKRWPEAGILLCSDDGGADLYKARGIINTGVHQAFAQRYGSRVVWRTPLTLDRTEVAALQDAVIDLWLLRSVDAFVGTVDSSFSELACYGRQIPVIWAEPDDQRYRVLALALRLSGAAQVLQGRTGRRFQRELSLVRLINYYSLRVRNKFSYSEAGDWQRHALPVESFL